MNKSELLLFSLIRYSLWNISEVLPKEIPPMLLTKLLQMAEAQTTLGLVIDALFRNNISIEKKYIYECVGILEQIKETNRKLNKDITSFAALMDENHVGYVMVKGQAIASQYINPLLRMPGDIDFYVNDYSLSSKILTKYWHIYFPQKIIGREVAFEHNGVTYELHTSLVQFSSRKHQQVWKSMMQNNCFIININDSHVNTLPPVANAIYVFSHLFFHFIREGIGLRQMCDWAIILNRYKDEIDPTQLASDLEGLGMKKAYRAFGGVLTTHLGLKSFPLALTDRDLNVSEKILKDILRYGNFGKPSRKVKQIGWKFKLETMCRTFRNCWKYFWLSPKEVGMIVPRLIALNVKLRLCRKQNTGSRI